MTEPTPELLSVVLPLTALDVPSSAGARDSWGYAAYSLLLSLLRSWDAALAQSLHDDQNPAPLTASTLIGQFQRGLPVVNRTYQLRLTAYSPQTTAFLQSAIAPGGKLSAHAEVEIDHLPFRVQANLNPAPDSRWVRAETYQQLSSSTLMGSDPPRYVSLQFHSPTLFKTGGQLFPFPIPKLVFGHLLEKWNRFAPLALPEEIRQYAEKCLLVSRFELHSRTASLPHSGKRPGSVGWVSYGTNNYDRYWMGQVHALAAFAFYVGVGKHTSMGLGQTTLGEISPKKNRRIPAAA